MCLIKTFFSLFLSVLIADTLVQAHSESGSKCSQRCRRLHDRSLARIRFDDEKVALLFEKQKPLGTLKDVCWRMYDYMDCMKRCPSHKDHDKLVRNTRFKCRSILSDFEDKLTCISRYHSFIEVRCSSFVNEAIRIRKQQSLDLTPDKETCRYLHLNSLCLENTVNTFCPRAKKIFRRLNFRDYFLNFIVPENDLLFDDEDLDSCQIYNFVKLSGKSDADHVEDELTTLRSRLDTDDDVETETEEMSQTEQMTSSPASVTFFAPSPSPSKRTDKKEFTDLLEDLLSTDELIDATTVAIFTSKDTKRVSSLTDDFESSTKLNESTSIKFGIEENTTETTTLSSRETTEFLNKLIGKIEKSAKKTLKMLEESEKPKNISQKEDDAIDNQLNFMDILDDETPETQITSSTMPNSVTPVKMSTEPTIQTTTTRRLFSDDSMEDIPPNFMYSSVRAHRYTVPMKEEDVTPINLHTSTMFGEDFKSSESTSGVSTPGEKYEYNNKVNSMNDKENENLEITTISMGTSPDATTMTPLLRRGHIVRKPILSWNEEDKSYEHETIEVIHQNGHKNSILHKKTGDAHHRAADYHDNGLEEMEDEEEDEEVDDDYQYDDDIDEDFLKTNSIEPSTHQTSENDSDNSLDWNEVSEIIFNGKKLLIFIYLILFAILLLALIFGFFFCFSCKKRSSDYEIAKY